VIGAALRRGMGVDSALRPFLHEDAEFPGLAMQHRAELRSVGLPVPHTRLRRYTGEIERVSAERVAVVGTGHPTGGKNVTAVRLTEELNRRGLRAVMVGTSEAAWFQGVRHTVLLDSVLHPFVSGELERTIIEADCELRPEVIVLEGAGSLLDPGRPAGLELLTTARPSGVILQHAPALFADEADGERAVARHVKVIEAVAGCPVIGIALSHVRLAQGLGVCRDEAETCRRVAARLCANFDVPVVDVLARGASKLAEALCCPRTCVTAACRQDGRSAEARCPMASEKITTRAPDS
jgi:uncharacterized NAD-dependent epimerase/dehydratase family protein